MFTFAKSAILSLSLIAGVVVAAHAQSSNIATLPPEAAPATAVAPSGVYPGPNPGKGWYSTEERTQRVAPSPPMAGVDPGQGWYPREQQTQPVQPSGAYPGTKPN